MLTCYLCCQEVARRQHLRLCTGLYQLGPWIRQAASQQGFTGQQASIHQLRPHGRCLHGSPGLAANAQQALH